MFEVLPRTRGPRIAIRLEGNLSEEDVVDMRAYLTGVLQHHPSLSLLFVMAEWTGWEEWKALWEDVNTDIVLNSECRAPRDGREGHGGPHYEGGHEAVRPCEGALVPVDRAGGGLGVAG